MSAAEAKTQQFQAEVSQLLNIVINSLYTDREIFVRELISNASDALEKLRHIQLTEKDNIADNDKALEIRIHVDEEAKTFAITDTGLGMNEEEAVNNLGTIAKSGSREFLKQLEEGENIDAKNLIGQFGVGFYSAFMAAKKITVHSRSWHSDATPVVWASEGKGDFTIRETDGMPRGTTITVDLKDDADEFSKVARVKDLIQRYSNFVPFPIFVNDEQVNTVQPLWTKSKDEITDEEMTEFYRFVSNAFDEPTYKFHFNADAPLAIRSLLFVPGDNMEKFGFGRMEPGVSLYCRRVLIQTQVEELLPDYFRFIRGVVDSEDLPLNISRETMQDSALIAKLRRVLSKRLIKFFAAEAKNDPEKYEKFFATFGTFLKEGVASDFDLRNDLAKLLRYQSSADEKKMTSLDDYVSRMKDDQKAIYYITGATRDAIEAGPYAEAITARGMEVLFCTDGIDDFVMTSLREYEGKKLISADQDDLELPDDENKDEETGLNEKDAGDLARWIKETLGDTIQEVRVSKRLVTSPAALVNPDSSFTTGMRRMMQAVSKETLTSGQMILEVNPKHAILGRLNELRSDNEKKELAESAAKMLLDNAQIAAGLMVDPKSLVERNTKILEAALAQ